MAQTKPSKAPTVVTVTKPWQVAFVTTLLAGQLVWVVMFLWSMSSHGSYISSGTWWWQLSFWLYPALYLAAGYVFAIKRVRGLIPRLFWSVFLATIGQSVSQVASALTNNWRASHMMYSADGGLWDAFGWDWTQMSVMFVLYCLALWLIARRKRA